MPLDGAHSPETITEWADKAIVRGVCPHVRRNELMPRDGVIYAVYDYSCFDSSECQLRCDKKGTGNLLIVAVRGLTPEKHAMRVSLRLEATPSTAVRIDGGHEKGGIHHLNQLAFVLHPTYKAQPSRWVRSIPIHASSQDEPVDGSLDVYASVKRDSPRPSHVMVNLPITIPGQQKEERKLPLDLESIVIGESIKLLVKEGWNFLKGKTGGAQNDLVVLHLGNTPISEEAMRSDSVVSAVKAAKLQIDHTAVQELQGLNKRLQTLSTKKKNLFAGIERGVSVKDKADAQTEIDELGLDIEGVREAIWSILSRSGVHASAEQRS